MNKHDRLIEQSADMLLAYRRPQHNPYAEILQKSDFLFVFICPGFQIPQLASFLKTITAKVAIRAFRSSEQLPHWDLE